MIRHGLQRIMQGLADRSPLLAGQPEPPRVSFDLLNWQPSPAERVRPQ
jgi:hypothetical protein